MENISENPYDPKAIYRSIFGEKMRGRFQKWPDIQFDILKEVNPDVVGWIHLDQSPINYPVVAERPGKYYLRHNFSQEESIHGAVELDVRNGGKVGEYVTSLSAHNMKDWSMFAGIIRLDEEEYRKKRPCIDFLTEEKRYRARVFAGCFTRHYDPKINKVIFRDRDRFQDWLDLVMERDEMHTGIIPDRNARLLACHTCAFDEKPDHDEYMVLGILEEVS